MFTYNNPEGLLDPSDFGPHLRYMIYQEEVGESGNYHFQGYLEFQRPVRRSALLIGPHYEIARGKPSECIAYCSKEETRVGGPYTFGEPSRQGERVDLMDCKDDMDQGMSMAEISSKHFATFIR